MRSRVLRGAQPERKEEDVFPAFYRLNTLRDISRLFPEPRFRQASCCWDASPPYHFDSPFVFRLFSWLHSVSPNAFKTTLSLHPEKPIADRRWRSLLCCSAALGPPTS
jgi:hypothetical protein